MKKVILLILVSICCFLFISCNMSKLEAPVNVKIENNVCTWNIVGNASQYQVIIDNDVYSSFSNKYDLSEANLIAGKTYSVRIKAISGSIFIQSSDYSEAIKFEYISSTNKEISSVTSLFDIGLTYGVNAIKDESVSNGLSTKNSNIFDLDKLSDSDIGKNQILLSKGNTNSSESINEVIKECNANLVFGQNTDIDILSGMFTLGYEKKFKLDVVSKHNQRKYQYYYVQKQYINSYNYQIKNYQLKDELSKKLSKSFINSIVEIKDSDDNFVDLIENLFNT